MHRWITKFVSSVFILSSVVAMPAQPAGVVARVPADPGEQRAVRAFEAARRSPLQLQAFLVRMPKGGDLHNHLSGAVYAETFIKDAIADGLCVNRSTLVLFRPAATTFSNPPQPVCGEGSVRAAEALQDQHLYDALVDAFSMRAFVPSSGISGHDQFFSTFDRFRALDADAHTGEWIDEAVTRAAAQNEQYLELMVTPPFTKAVALANRIGWPASEADGLVGREQLATLRGKLLAGGLRDEIAADQKQIGDAETQRLAREHCSAKGSALAGNSPCDLEVRFLYQILRGFPPQQVFAQTLLGFETVTADIDSKARRFAGINIVMPEDGRISMQDYHQQMLMIDYLHSVYPKVRISLHAGELAPGLVTPEGLRFHIREALELGHAERIGHGVDVMYESDPKALLKEMADRHVMVEINLTSNDVILGVINNRHPLPEYRAAGVPTAFSTDDEGVSRIDLTHEYTRAALEFNLGYLDLKRSARTTLEHSFLSGAGLWQQPDNFTRPVAACSGQRIGVEHPSAACRSFLDSSERAAEQWELERRYQRFESGLP